MVTLLPALLVIFGRWVFWPKRPTFGSAEPTAHRLLGPGRQPDRACGRARCGSAPPSCSPIACLGLFTLDADGLSTEDQYTKEFDSIIGQKVLDDARPGRQLQPAHGRRQRRRRPTPWPRRMSGGRRPRRARHAGPAGRTASRSSTATVAGRRRRPRPRSTRSTRSRDAVHAGRRRRRARRRHVGDLPRHRDGVAAATTW